METIYDVQASIKGQKELCVKNKYPHFAPHSGKCYYCKINIYELDKSGIHESGINTLKATNTLITGCPHCHHTYCD